MHNNFIQIFRLLILCLAAVVLPVQAYPDGITGAAGQFGDCTGCHFGGSYNYTALVNPSSTTVARNTAVTVTFSVTYVSGSFAKDTGLNVASEDGVGAFTEGSALLQEIGNEITHMVPQPSNSLTVGSGNVGAGYTWPSFTWTSPNTSGTYTLYGCGNMVSGNRDGDYGNGIGENGDNPVCDTVNIVVNDPPVITQGASVGVTMSEDGSPTPFSLTLNATDTEGGTITWSIFDQANNGTATASGTGSSKAIGYTPTSNYNGSDSFIVRVTDSIGQTDNITVNVTINAVNDAPVITQGASTPVTMSEDSSPTPFSLTLNATDTESVGTSLTWSIFDQANNGTASASGTGASKAISYTPNSNYNGSDSFVVRVTDANGGTDDITVNVTINAVNDAPVITQGASTGVTMSEDGSPTPFSLTLNATDTEGSTITWSILTQGSNGTASASGTGASKAIGYTPTSNYNGSDSFVVRISDGSLTDDITVNVTINSVNDAPVITEGASTGVTMSEDSTPTPFSLTLNATDTESAGGSLTWSIFDQANNGTASASGTGASKAITYTPNANHNGSDVFIVRVTDANGGTDDITVNVTINAVADTPVITEGASIGVTMSEDGSPTAFSLTLNATDGDNDTLTWSIFTAAGNGTASASGTGSSKAIGYTPTAHYFGADSFVVRVSDGNGGTDNITVNVTVNSVNDVPQITANNGLTMLELTTRPITNAELAASDADAADTASVLTYTITTAPANGTLFHSLNGALDDVSNNTFTQDDIINGRISYQETVDDATSDSFVFNLDDAAGAGPDGETFNITITLNSPPVVTAGGTLNYSENAGAQTLAGGITVTDSESDDITGATVQITGNHQNSEDALGFTDQNGITGSFNSTTGMLSLSGTATAADYQTALRSVTYTNSSEDPSTAIRTVSFQVTDANASNVATRDIAITQTNDAPTSGDRTININEDTPRALLVADFTFNDVDGDSLAGVRITQIPGDGSLTLSGNPVSDNDNISAANLAGNLVFTPVANENGSPYTTLQFRVSDGTTLSVSTHTLTINVGADNDAPQPVGGTIALTAVNENSVLSGVSVVSGFTDAENNGLDYELTTGSLPTGVSLTESSGELSGSPTVAGTYNFSITATETDGSPSNLVSAPQAFSWTINETFNDTPQATGGTISLTPANEDTALSGVSIAGDFSDEDGNDLDYAVTAGSLPTGVSLNTANGDLTGTPTVSGNYSFSITATETDGNPTDLASDPQAYDWTIVETVNDAPVEVGGTVTLPAGVEGTPLAGVSVAASFSDEENDTLTFALASGALPTSVALNANTGALSGTPSVSGVYTFGITATDNGTPNELSGVQAFSITIANINDAPTRVGGTVALPAVIAGDPIVGVSVASSFSDEDGNTLSYALSSGALPSGVSLNAATGALQGTPVTWGGFSFSVIATETNGSPSNLSSPAQAFSLTVNIIDTDSDTVPDFLDNCPLDGNNDQEDNDGDGDGDACDADDDNDGMPDTFEQANGFDPMDDEDANEDADGDGLSNLEEFLEDTDPTSDDVPPEFSGIGNLRVKATGYLTPVDLGDIRANDFADGGVDVVIQSVNGPTSIEDARRSLFRSGRTIITYRATDSSNNSATATQRVDVRPLASFIPDQVAAEDGSIEVKVLLSGEAPQYPVTVDYLVSGTSNSADHDAEDGTVTINSGTEGVITVDIDGDSRSEGNETLILTLTDPVNAALGSSIQHTITIVEGNVPPAVSLLAQQGIFTGPLVVADRGLPVTLVAAVNDPNEGDTFTYRWESELDQTNSSGSSTFEFDPEGLAGVYVVTLIVTDSSGASVSQQILLNIKETAPELDDTDSDSDGVPDEDEGYVDTDNDGVPDHLDAYEQPGEAHLAYNQTGNLPSSRLLQTEPGLSLRMGAVGLYGNASGLLISKADIEAYASALGLSFVDDDMFNIGGLYDFEVHGVTPGAAARVVIPLLARVLAGSSYRKLNPQSGWHNFVTANGNAIATARSANGICPAPGHNSYRNGLNAFDDCLQLTLVDGGPNDADGNADGVIRDPGGVAVSDPSPEPEPGPAPDDGSGGGSGGGGGGVLHPFWLLLLMLWVALRFAAPMRRASNGRSWDKVGEAANPRE